MCIEEEDCLVSSTVGLAGGILGIVTSPCIAFPCVFGTMVLYAAHIDDENDELVSAM
jgi:hypothetical protein